MEKNVGGEKRPTIYTLRNANNKTLEEIESEISKAAGRKNTGVFTDHDEKNPGTFFSRMPRFVRKAILKYVLYYNPFLRKKVFGTASFSSVGMFGDISGWGIPLTSHAIHFVAGGIGKKPRFIKGELKNRELLSVTMSIDHDFIDGAPATRFAMGLMKMAKEGYGLTQYMDAR